MRELAKGTCGSVVVHALALGLFSLATVRLAVPGSGVQGVGLSFGSGPGGGKAGARGAAMRTVDVSRLARKVPASAAKSAKPPVAVKAKARSTPLAATAKTATSRTGPAVLTDQKRKAEADAAEERIARIRRSARLVAANPAPSARTGARTDADPDDIAARVRGRLQGSGIASGGTAGKDTDGDGDGGRDGDGDGGGAGDPFYGALSRALYALWEPPAKAEVGGANPEVGVSITIRSDGTVLGRGIVRPSGVKAMDDSVLRLLRQLRTLPAPATFGLPGPVRTVEITFTLDAVQER